MKKIFYFVVLLFSIAATAQVPGFISYRAKAVDPMGAVLNNTGISLKISILDSGSTVLYAETFNRTTDNNGDYNLEIGNGAVVTGTTLLALDWNTGSKFLRIDMDPDGSGPSPYALVGTSQLLSVPYAFVAQKALTADNVNADSGMRTVESIYSLRQFSDFDPTSEEPAVYVKGYSEAADGGGGVFIFKRKALMGPWGNPRPAVPACKIPTEDYGIIIDSDITPVRDEGIWIRQFSGDIDIRWYGVFGHGETEYQSISSNDRIQYAINYAANSVQDVTCRPYGHNRSNTVYFPNGSYQASRLVLKTGVSLRGAGKKHTVIQAIDDAAGALFVLDKGVVRDVHISNLALYGTREARNTKACFYIKGEEIDTENNRGAGLWDSSFRNLDIQFFTGHSLYFEGGSGGPYLGDINYFILNQFLVFEGVYVESVGQLRKRPGDPDAFYNNAHALSIGGLNGQFSFNNCRFDGGSHLFGATSSTPNYWLSGMNVYIGPMDKDPKKTNGVATPSCINFNTCTFQHGEIGIYIDSCRNINIYGGWFENFERAITVVGNLRPAKSINIMNNQYGRSAGRYGTVKDNTGSIITYENALLNVYNNYVADYYDEFNEHVSFIRLEDNPGQNPIDWRANSGVNTIGNSFLEGGPELDTTWGLDKIIYNADITATLMAENARLVTLYAEGTKTVSKIVARIGAAEMINVRCAQGKIKFVETDNIDLGTTINSLTLSAGEVATFVKVENMNNPGYVTYRLVSYNH